ncbi:sigma-70 family RNA polymerase sigma factor [soil metagenome]
MKYLRDEDDSKDAVMQIFEKLLRELQKHEIGFFKAWLHTVAKNHCLMKLRSKPKEISGMDHVFVENASFVHPAEVGIDPALEKERNLSNMEVAIQKLDANQKTCIELFYLKEMSYLQVAEITGYDLNQVKSYIQNGKRNLKIILSKDAEADN